MWRQLAVLSKLLYSSAVTALDSVRAQIAHPLMLAHQYMRAAREEFALPYYMEGDCTDRELHSGIFCSERSEHYYYLNLLLEYRNPIGFSSYWPAQCTI